MFSQIHLLSNGHNAQLEFTVTGSQVMGTVCILGYQFNDYNALLDAMAKQCVQSVPVIAFKGVCM